MSERQSRWTESADVVVVGCGFAGAVAAIAARDAGASVLVVEKMPDAGGISVCSFGGVRTAKSAAAALTYLRRTNADTAPDGVLKVLARGMVDLPRQIAALARGVGARPVLRPSPANYPFPGNRTFGFVNIEEIDGFDPASAYPHVRGAPGGAMMFQMLERNLALRGIEVRTRMPVRRLIADATGRICGVIVRRGRGETAIRVRRAVVLTCGGFEASPDMQRQFWVERPVLNAAFRGNTGDGIRMAQQAGADLWHMWHYHGSYGFAHTDPGYPFGIRTKRLPDWQPGQKLRGDVRMPWILLDRRGRRFVNEYDPYLQDTGARAFTRYDPMAQDYAATPAWLIADSVGARLYPFGRPTWNERGVGYEWSADNTREIALGILKRAGDMAALARGTGIAMPALQDAVRRWNAQCRDGRDADWGRPPTSMMPIRKPPFVYGCVWPIVSNTQGGPVHDARQRVLRPDGTPIPGLYAAGELGSVFGHLYMSGGNIAECFVGGRIAGREAARTPAA